MKKFIFATLLLFVLGIGISVEAIKEPGIPPIDPEVFPTYKALSESVVNAQNPLELALALGLVERDYVYEVESLSHYELGQVENFWVNDDSIGGLKEIETELVAIGEYSYVWAEVGSYITAADAQAFAEAFDTSIYSEVRELWGNEDSPGVDGDVGIHMVFANDIGDSLAAYYTSQNEYPSVINAGSNQKEMLTFNLSATGHILNQKAMLSIAAHEFQHLIRHYVDNNEVSWMDEGSSVFTEFYLDLDRGDWMAQAFLFAPGTQLNDWGNGDNIIADYGAAFLFIRYLYDRFGLETLREISQSPVNGLLSIDQVLLEEHSISVDEVFADWVVANALQGEVPYGYADNEGLSHVNYTQIISLPYEESGLVNQYGTQYFRLKDPVSIGDFTLSLTTDEVVNLVPTSAYSGDWMWYSNKADDSFTSLTRAFDLSTVEEAHLSFKTWYNIEDYWDYAYLLISEDAGESWEILSSDLTTTEDPNGKIYGEGYTGKSDGWLNVDVDLSAYSGQEVWVRFAMLTDDASTYNGMLIDDVTIPEINYSDDFESVDTEWVADGWIRIDNRLPQRAWLQIVQTDADGSIQLERQLISGSSEVAVRLGEDTVDTWIMISPFAPLTLEKMPYEMRLR